MGSGGHLSRQYPGRVPGRDVHHSHKWVWGQDGGRDCLAKAPKTWKMAIRTVLEPCGWCWEMCNALGTIMSRPRIPLVFSASTTRLYVFATRGNIGLLFLEVRTAIMSMAKPLALFRAPNCVTAIMLADNLHVIWLMHRPFYRMEVCYVHTGAAIE